MQLSPMNKGPNENIEGVIMFGEKYFHMSELQNQLGRVCHLHVHPFVYYIYL